MASETLLGMGASVIGSVAIKQRPARLIQWATTNRAGRRKIVGGQHASE
jgi:hypothetical protein